jgi:hypothetical protein
MRNMIRATTAITIKIPKPIPALNIPVTTLHDESRKTIRSIRQMAEIVDVFMVFKVFQNIRGKNKPPHQREV